MAQTQYMQMQGTFHDLDNSTVPLTEGEVTPALDPIALDIPDKDLGSIIDKRIENYNDFYKGINLFDRRKKNEMYLFGRQILWKEEQDLIKNYQSKYMDNVLYEIEATIKPLTMSRLPDLMVVPGDDGEKAQLIAQEVGKAVDTEIKSEQNRRVLGLASKHLPVYFVGVIKCLWNPELDDYEFACIHPDLIEFDYTTSTNNTDDMQFVSQLVPATVQKVLMRFPKKKDEFLAEVRRHNSLFSSNSGEAKWSELATTVNYREIWFTWYKQGPDETWERIEGVMMKYYDVILAKMKNPNFDYEGETRFFAYDQPGEESTKRALNEDETMQLLTTGMMPPNVVEEQVYHNYFSHPRKPYFFMGYDQWGKQPLDETSRIEQNIQNQESLDKRGQQIEETLDERGHHVFSKEAGLTAQDIEEMDLNDPNQDLVVAGDVNNVHKFIEPARPTAPEFNQMNDTKQNMYAIAGANAVRGDVQTDVATSNQIARESDFTRADDLVAETINPAAQWMGEWALQMIKLRYTKEHFRYILGDAGEMVWIALNRNMISEGMLVKMKASGTDKMRAQNNALQMAKLELIDPFTFFKDMGLSDPEGRTEKLMLAKMDPIAYLQKVVQGISTSEALAGHLERLSQQQLAQAQMKQLGIAPQPPQQPPIPPMVGGGAPNPMMAGGQPGQPAQAPTPGNTQAVPTEPPAGPPAASPRGIL